MSTYGRSTLQNVGRSIKLTADGQPEMKHGGITVDWAEVAAVAGADVTLEDGVIILIGEKYLRYGQVMTQIGVAEVQTITYTGGATAGNMTPTLPASGGESAITASAQAFNVTAAAMEASLRTAWASRLGPTGVSVTRTGTGIAADPYIYTLTLSRNLSDVPTITSTHTFTGGTTPTATHAVTTAGEANSGKYGPFDPAATDGRQTLSRGFCFIVNQTTKENDLHSDQPPALYGGLVFKERLIATTGTNSLAAGPTFTNLEAAFPRLAYVAESPA